MAVRANHHVALRVSDVERSARFYVEGLGGHRQTSTITFGGPDAAFIMGVEGAEFKFIAIGFDEGTIELFEFLSPVSPVKPIVAAEDAVIHYAFQVDDVPATWEQALGAGATRYWPKVWTFEFDDPAIPSYQVVYLRDPDGHIVELIDIASDEMVRRFVAAGNAPTE